MTLGSEEAHLGSGDGRITGVGVNIGVGLDGFLSISPLLCRIRI